MAQASIVEKNAAIKKLLDELQSPSESEETEEVIYEHDWDVLRDINDIQATQKTQSEITQEKPAHSYFHFCGMDENVRQCTTWFLTKPTDESTVPSSKQGVEKERICNGKIHTEKSSQDDTLQVTLPDVFSKTTKKKFAKKPDYKCGSLVWAKVRGYCMWPGMIDDDPDYNTFHWMYDTIPPTMQYHVVFFDEENRLSRFWCLADQLKPFSEPLKNPPILKKPLLKRFEKGVQEATKASQLSIEDRLKIYGFKVRFNSPGIKLCED